MEKKGIDVSKWQKEIDWKKVMESGVDFAMIRLGYGASDGKKCVIDPYFNTNIVGASESGMDVGVYFYSYAKSASAAGKEAAFVIDKIMPYQRKLTYPIAFDLEDQSQKDLGKITLTAMVTTFCDAIEKAGYFATLYCNLDWCKRLLEMEDIKDYDLWLAQWASKPTTDYPLGMWQYTNAGVVPGIRGQVDMNIAYKDYPTIIANLSTKRLMHYQYNQYK
ncbi:MAG: glycoside hydrolase family 25 protein [Lachnospiraceae bacterium]|jgi:GH25 family lysozyme M1 (1,4-beta-N-acetylmuramidase)|nr:glycoside hydrolase family 25 protein [Lachnospiraceae bacterium]